MKRGLMKEKSKQWSVLQTATVDGNLFFKTAFFKLFVEH
ncbi:MAG: hypothetical protein ACI82Z_001252 [Cellvibrionaceae bacterium]|jgi:hypothetical protein